MLRLLPTCSVTVSIACHGGSPERASCVSRQAFQVHMARIPVFRCLDLAQISQL